MESESTAMTTVKPRGRILTTEAELKRFAREAREREKYATKIRKARYDPATDAVVSELSTGVTLSVPRRLIPGFAHAPASSLTDLEINPGSESLWSETVDDGVLLEQLIAVAAGDELLELLGGRISGRRRSPAKATASRVNGAKGGRPPLSMASFLRALDEKLHALVPDAPHMDTRASSNDQQPVDGNWRVGDLKLRLKAHGRNEVHVTATWTRRRAVERRIRATADRLAREFARELATSRTTDSTVHATATRARPRGTASQRRRPPRPRVSSAATR
jgi:hypothetical protein